MELLDDVEKLITNEWESAHGYYADHVKWPRISFRVLGLITLGLSVIIPFISQKGLDIHEKELWITGLSLCITVITGISTFFRPEETWKLNMGAKLNLESLYAHWKLECIEAKSLASEEEIVKKHIEVSKKFLRAAQAVTAANTEGFFANVSFPEKE